MDRVLVLNSDYSPLNITTLTRGFVLVNKGKAEVVKKGDDDIVTSIGNFVRPIIIRLLEYIKYRPRITKVSRRRIFQRDNHTCQYCGSKRNLTIDHILPRSRNGNNSWENLITCCFRCNSIKGNRTPQEANMKLLTKPYEPSIFSDVIYKGVSQVWDEFKESFK